MSVVYPLFVFLDDQTMMTIESPDRILSYLEGIDIKNGEYRFWDPTERAVRITVELTNAFYLFSHWKVVDVFYCESTMTLRDALLKYAEALNLPRISVDGKPIETLERIETTRPRRKNWLSRLFSS
jgi:hypothetical protein